MYGENVISCIRTNVQWKCNKLYQNKCTVKMQ